MAYGEKVMKWEDILAPCPITPFDKVWVFIEVPKHVNPRERIASVLKEWGIPYAFFPNDNHLLSCRIHMIFEDKDDKVKIYFGMDPIECKAMETIELGIKLLKEARLINDDDENQVRDLLTKRWRLWITNYAPILPKLWKVLLTIDANDC
jgi:hypothetical protein